METAKKEIIKTDVLFEYLCVEKPCGTWGEFKNFIDRLNYYDEDVYYNNYREIFSRLGHIEFEFGSNNKYSVAEPVLCVNKNSEYGFLAGFRSKTMFDNIEENFGEIEKLDNFPAPKLLKIKIKNRLDEFSEKFPKIKISLDFPTKLLNVIPSFEQEILKIKKCENFIEDFKNIRFYDCSRLNFSSNYNKDELKKGLYEKNIFGHRFYAIYNDEGWFETDKNFGIIYALKLENVEILKYKNSCLYVKNINSLPELYDRALAANSGLNPIKTGIWLEYKEIDLNFARKFAKKLALNLIEE